MAKAILLIAAAIAATAAPLPVARQNELVRRYCAVCHTDASMNGGLSLEHFDSAELRPGLKAMMLSKLTGGVPLATVRAAASDPAAAAVLERRSGSGAMGAAGVPLPDKPTVNALAQSLAEGADGATAWNVDQTGTASILREVQTSPEENESYRLIVSCDGMQLTWSPAAQSGQFHVSADGGGLVEYKVEGSEAMGNGSGLVLRKLASTVLATTPIPTESLTVTDLFPGQTVRFSFSDLPADARRQCKIQ